MRRHEKAQREKLDASVFEAVPEGWPASVHPLTLASSLCVFCRGSGIRRTEIKSKPMVCGCVYRRVFRECLSRWTRETDSLRGSACIEVGKGGFVCTRPSSEFLADFEALSRKAMRCDVQRHILEFHFLRGHDYKWCFADWSRFDASLNFGQWWHEVYAAQELIGRRLATVQPYRLWPLDEYFGINTTKVYWRRNTKGTGQHSTTLQPQPMHLPFNGIRNSKQRAAAARAEQKTQRSMPHAA